MLIRCEFLCYSFKIIGIVVFMWMHAFLTSYLMFIDFAV